MKIHPALIGLICACLMMAVLLSGYYKMIPSTQAAQLFAYGIYALGIFVTLKIHGSPSTGFRSNFSTGFRCLIVVTLCLVVFSYVFNSLHPEIARQEAAAIREEIQRTNNNFSVKAKQEVTSSPDRSTLAENRTPEEIERDLTLFVDRFPIVVVSRSIFGYLLAGALFTAIGALVQTLRRKY